MASDGEVGEKGVGRVGGEPRDQHQVKGGEAVAQPPFARGVRELPRHPNAGSNLFCGWIPALLPSCFSLLSPIILLSTGTDTMSKSLSSIPFPPGTPLPSPPAPLQLVQDLSHYWYLQGRGPVAKDWNCF